MDIRKVSDEWINLYNNYNIQIIVKTGVYTSHVFNYEKDIITDIAFIDINKKETIYKRNLYNNFILFDTINNIVDEIAFYTSFMKKDNLDMENLIDKLSNNSMSILLFRIKNEIKKHNEEKTREILINTHNKTKNALIKLCNNNNFKYIFTGTKIYIIKLNDNININDDTLIKAIEENKYKEYYNIVFISNNIECSEWYKTANNEFLQAIKVIYNYNKNIA